MDPSSSSDPVLQLVLFLQFLPCLYLGYRTAKKTGRSMLAWVAIGAVASVLPLIGPILMVVSVLWMPPPLRRNPGPPPAPEQPPSHRRRRPPRDR